MDKKTLLLKYLDNELNGQERAQVEELLKNEPDAKQILEEIQSKRQMVVDHLDYLKPTADIIIPEWEVKKTSHQPKVKPIYKVLKWAAVLIIPIGIYFTLHETMNPRNQGTKEQPKSELSDNITNIEQKLVRTKKNDLDYAVSPNRSWNKKLLIKSEFNTKAI